jgi:hypothetical protein
VLSFMTQTEIRRHELILNCTVSRSQIRHHEI